MIYRLGVVGSPIAHSLSPALHRAALEHWGLEGSSEPIEVGSHDIEQFGRLTDSFHALSVTMPLKELFVPLCDDLDEVARRVGAINTLARRGGVNWGRNTDGRGFLDALKTEFDLTAAGRVCVVRGSGGTARSLVDALFRARAAEVHLVARNLVTAKEIAKLYPELGVNSVSINNVEVIVNTVPFSESSIDELDEVPMTFSPGAAAYDVIYHPVETPWLAAQRHGGRRTANGLSMLVHQARHQLEWWFDREISPGVLFAAVRR
jgi:shikimate dehydrogenase